MTKLNDHSEPMFEASLITPEQAAKWLEQNAVNNRALSPARVDGYVRDMKAGKWKLTHQAIAFDWDDNLLDGQHRLHAIVKAGIPVLTMVAIGCDPATFPKIDVGGPRVASDLFTIAYKDKHGVAPVAPTWVTSIAVAMLRGVKGKQLQRDMVWQYALRHYDEISLVRLALCKNRIVTTQVMGAFANARAAYGPDSYGPLGELMERLNTEMWSGVNDPCKALHARLIKAKLKERRQDVVSELHKYALSCSAIRAALQGRQRTKLEVTDCELGESEEDRKIMSQLAKTAKARKQGETAVGA